MGTTVDYLENTHPGEILHEEFLVPMGITAYRLAKDTGMPQTRISQIIRGQRSVMAETAVRLPFRDSKFGGVANLSGTVSITAE